MSRYKTICPDVEIEICLDEFSDDDLREEVEYRGLVLDEQDGLTDEGRWQRGNLEQKMQVALFRGLDTTELVREYLKLRGYCV